MQVHQIKTVFTSTAMTCGGGIPSIPVHAKILHHLKKWISYYLALLLWVFVFVPGPAAAAKVYKWTDENGGIHYSQVPPDQKTQEQEMDIKSNQPVSETTNRKPPESSPAKETGKNEEKAGKESPDQAAKNAEIEKKNEEIRQKNCKIAKQQVMTINQGGRLYEVDEKGERQYWDDATRASKLAEAQKSVDEWCKTP